MIKFQGATKPANLFCASQKLAGFGNLKFEILKSVKQDLAPYRFAREILYRKILSRIEQIYPTPKVRGKFRMY